MPFARANGITLHYRLDGPAAGSPLVLVNSLGTDARIWDDVVATLSQRYRILSYDKRGHGLSDGPPGDYRLEDHVADVLGLADLLGFGRFAVVGVSVGGMIAMSLAADHPDRIAAAVFSDTARKIGSSDMWDARMEAVSAGGVSSISEAILARWFTPGFKSHSPAQYAGWRNLLERSSSAGYRSTCATLRDADITDDLQRISIPTLMLCGSQDLSTPPDLVRETAARIAGCRFELIADCGHIPSIEQPEVMCRFAKAYLGEVGYV